MQHPRSVKIGIIALVAIGWFAYFWFRLRDPGSSRICGGVDLFGRQSYVGANSSTINVVLLFDFDFVNQVMKSGSHVGEDSEQYQFQLKDGRAFQFENNERDSYLTINGKTYYKAQGRVFIIRPVADGFEAQQLAITFDKSPHEITLDNVADHVRAEVQKATQQHKELREFLNLKPD